MELILLFFFLIFSILFLFMTVYLGRITLYIKEIRNFLLTRFKDKNQ